MSFEVIIPVCRIFAPSVSMRACIPDLLQTVTRQRKEVAVIKLGLGEQVSLHGLLLGEGAVAAKCCAPKGFRMFVNVDLEFCFIWARGPAV